MKISTKGRYALKIMLDLAENVEEGYVNVKNIANRQGISEKYLEQIISVLNKAGFVKSTRGAQGGYKLTKTPNEYTVGMILRVTEGSLSPVACLEDETNECERCGSCQSLRVWEKIDKAINEVVDNMTLADLLN